MNESRAVNWDQKGANHRDWDQKGANRYAVALVPRTNLGCRMASVEDESRLGRSSERGVAAVVWATEVSPGSRGMDVEAVQRESGAQSCIAGVNLVGRHVPEYDRSQLLLVPRVRSRALVRPRPVVSGPDVDLRVASWGGTGGRSWPTSGSSSRRPSRAAGTSVSHVAGGPDPAGGLAARSGCRSSWTDARESAPPT